MLKVIWERISTSGLNANLDQNQVKLVRIVNQVLILAIFVTIIFSIPELYLGKHYFFLYSLASATVYVLFFYLNKKGFYDLVRFGLIFIALLNIVFFSSLHGQNHGSHYFLIPVLMGSFAIFSNNETGKLIFTITLIFGAWIFLEVTGYSTFTHLKSEGPLEGWVSMLNFGLSLITTLVVMIYFTRETRISEQAVNENQEHLQSVINSTDNGIWLIDRKYVLLTFNRTFADWCEKICGRKIVPGNNLMKLLSGSNTELSDHWKNRFDTAFETGKSLVWEHQYDEGSLSVYLETILSPVWVGGKVIALTGFAHDLTNRRKAEVDLENAKKRAEDASRAKSMFLSNLSHELRTPLNAIYGLSQIIKQSNKDKSNDENLQTILTSTEHLTSLINNLLDFTDIKDGKFRLVYSLFSLRDCMHSVVASYKQIASQKGISLSKTIDEHLPEYVTGDSARFIQVVSILVDNAIKFTHEGEVSIAFRALSVSKENLLLQVSVKDTGPGIDIKTQDKLFEVFEKADNRDTRIHGGTGLGLPIAKILIEAQGGKIHFNSEVGTGSEFMFDLPLKPSADFILDKMPSSARVSSFSLEDLKDVHILVVDDNDINRLMAKQVLKHLSYNHITMAAGGNQALEIIEHDTPDIILLDIQMPDMDGYEVASRIRHSKNCQNLPIIAISADIIQVTKDKAKASGMNDFIEKPIKIDVLKNMLEKHLVNA